MFSVNLKLNSPESTFPALESVTVVDGSGLVASGVTIGIVLFC